MCDFFRWFHPFVALTAALVLANGLALCLIFFNFFFAWFLEVVVVILSLAAVGFVATLWILGIPAVGGKGERPCSDTSPPIHVDALLVANGWLGMSDAPGRKNLEVQRNLETDLRRLKQLGYNLIVTMMETRELDVMRCASMKELVTANEMEWLHFPVRDKWIPPDTQKFLDLVRRIQSALHRGDRVLVPLQRRQRENWYPRRCCVDVFE